MDFESTELSLALIYVSCTGQPEQDYTTQTDDQKTYTRKRGSFQISVYLEKRLFQELCIENNRKTKHRELEGSNSKPWTPFDSYTKQI